MQNCRVMQRPPRTTTSEWRDAGRSRSSMEWNTDWPWRTIWWSNPQIAMEGRFQAWPRSGNAVEEGSLSQCGWGGRTEWMPEERPQCNLTTIAMACTSSVKRLRQVMNCSRTCDTKRHRARKCVGQHKQLYHTVRCVQSAQHPHRKKKLALWCSHNPAWMGMHSGVSVNTHDTRVSLRREAVGGSPTAHLWCGAHTTPTKAANKSS